MPHIFRKNTSGNWVEIKGIWRKFTVADAQGNFWRPVTFVWRRNTAGVWSQVYLQEDNLSQPTSGFTFTSSDASGDFFSGSTLTLTRGNWSNSPTEYRMRIQYGLSENDTVGTVAGPVTYTPANSTASTTLTYTLTAPDCLDPSYYYKGTINVDNAAGTNSRTATNQRRSKIKINFTFDSDLTPITSNGATARWTANVVGSLVGLSNDTFIDRINIIVTNQSGTIVKRWQHRPNGGTIEAGYTAFSPAKPTSTTFTYTFSDPAITSSGGQHSVQVQVYARDTDKTLYFDTKTFTPLFPKPVNTVIPVISDTTPTVGDQLTTTTGTWTGQTPLTYLYQWQSSLDGNTWSNISGATNNVFYVNPTSFYEGFRLRSRVIARDPQNQDGDPAFSLATSPVAQYVPNPVRNLAASASGTTITVTWDKPTTDPVWGSPSAYWIYLNGSYYGEDSTTSTSSETYFITGLSSGTYSVSVYPVYGDVFSAYALGEVRTVSNIVVVSPPTRTANPFVYSGTFREGETVSVAASGPTYWNGNPTSYNYEWGFFNSSIGEEEIYQSSSSNSFTIPNNYADNNFNPSDFLRVTVTATNAGGSAFDFGENRTVAQGQVPTNVSVSVTPTSGTAGTTQFTANPSATNATSYLYQWRFFNGTGGINGWVAISGATSQTYTPPANYVTLYGSGLRVSVIASNVFGPAAEVLSTTTTTVNAAVSPPSNTSIPTLSPTSLSVGTQLTAGIGTWSGTTPITYDLRIYRGTAGVLTSETLVASTTTTNSATTLNYTITQADFDSGQRYFRTYVNATNSGGSSGFVAGQERGPIATPPSVPTTPTSLSATTNRTDGVNLTFSGSTGQTSYEIFWNLSASGTPSSSASADFSNVSSPYLDTGISAGTSRYYWVRARNSSGTSEWFPATNGILGTRLSTPTTYTVTWNANGGTVSPTSSNVTAGSSVTAPTPTRSGYTFNGWYTASSGGSLVVNAGGSYTPSSSITLFAQWTLSGGGGGIPAVPTGVFACQNGSGTTIVWNSVPGATSYGIWYQSSASTYTGTGEDFSTTNNFIEVAVQGNWYWSVRAKNTSGNSAYSTSDFGGESCPI